MPIFTYKATNNKGEIVEGSMNEAAQDMVVKKLREIELIPIRISLRDDPETLEAKDFSITFTKVSGQVMLIFTRELASLLKAGMPLDRSLQILTDMSEQKQLTATLHDLLKDVRGGKSLADAMAKHGKIFSHLYVSMVRAGEVSGALDSSLEKLAEFQEETNELKNYIFSAMIYPAVLTFVMILSVMILFLFVIPSFAATFSDLGAAMPLPTVIILSMSNGFKDFWLEGLVLAIIGFAFWRYKITTPSGLYAWHTFKLKLPIFGDLIRRIEVARFTRTLGTILKGGVPMLQALSIVKDVADNTVIAATLVELRDRVHRGERIGDSLRDQQFIPSMAVEMITVGEETGQLHEMLLEVADTFDKQVRHRIKRLLALLEPALILFMGLVVGFIVVSMLIAIFSINDLAF